MENWQGSLLKELLIGWLKIIATAFFVLFAILASYGICRFFVPLYDIPQYLDMWYLLQNVIQFLPFVGDCVGLVFSAIGVSFLPQTALEIPALEEITFSLLLAASYQVMSFIHTGIRQYIERFLPIQNAIAICSNLACSFCVIVGSISVATLFRTVLSAKLTQAGYWVWAFILGGILLLVAVAAVRRQKRFSLGRTLTRILANAVIVLLIYAVAITGDCLINAEYLSQRELPVILISFILSTLFLSLLGSWFFADSFLSNQASKK